MSRTRLEAFSDAVIAIIITIMVLELRAPHGADWSALRPVLPTLLTYLLSFIYLGIYWSNHHHMLHMTERVNGAILWANLHLLFWLSMVPFATSWMGENHFASVPTALYGIVLLGAGISYWILQETIIAHQGRGSRLKAAVGGDVKGRGSMVTYACAIPLAFVNHWVATAIYIIVALVWLVPDPRIEQRISADERQKRASSM